MNPMNNGQLNMESLLDFANQNFDVALLDQVVDIFFDGSHQFHGQAHNLINKLQDHPQAWTRVDGILERSTSSNTKFLALRILQLTIELRWKTLDQNTRQGIRNYMITKILTLVTALDGPQKGNREAQSLLRKLNECLVAVLKQEWPHNWPTFIDEMVSSGKSSEPICENNMKVIGMLIEEIFDFSEEDMLSTKVTKLKESLKGEFAKVFELCQFALERSQRATLVSATLTTAVRFMSWVPLPYVFETPVLNLLVTRFLHLPQFRCDVLAVLTEVADFGSTKVQQPQYQMMLCQCFVAVMDKLNKMLPLQVVNIPTAFASGKEEERRFVLKLALFLKHFFANWLPTLESNSRECSGAMLLGMQYLAAISEVDDDVTFKICLEHWHDLTEDIYKQLTSFRTPAVLALGSGMMSVGQLTGSGGGSGTNGQNSAKAQNAMQQRQQWYGPVLHEVRKTMVSKMSKPKEVLVVENDVGEVVMSVVKDTDALAQYQTMRETLVFLTHLNYEDTESIMLEKLAAQVDGTQWTWRNLNTLCWAIGSISGAMNEDDEKRFLVTVIKDLLGLCENKRGKNNKAIIASNIMYVVGQYPRFLRAHWKFLKTVVNKNFEFMHELHPGVRDMACDTFLKIAQKCKRKFVVLQTQERSPFIEELLQNLPSTISDLESHQVQTYYEGVGHMVSAQTDPSQCQMLMQALMRGPNESWKQIMAQAGRDVTALHNIDAVKEIAKIIRINTRVVTAVGPRYVSQLGLIYLDMLNVYKAYSEFISTAIQRSGPQIAQHSNIRAMRQVKVEILTLIATFVEGGVTSKSSKKKKKSNNVAQSHVALIAQNFVPPLLVPVLADYQRGIPQARESQVLQLFTTIINTCKTAMTDSVPKVVGATLGCTLEMIATNMEDYPEHRIHFYLLLTAIVTHTFQAFFQIPPASQVSLFS
jgi:exportin-1